MCGFAGFLGAPNPELLQQMASRIAHRGPDQDGVFESTKISMTHKRLSIIDLSNAGRQPMHSSDGRFVISYNGEIYNYQVLRERYAARGWKFTSQSDTECFLASAALTQLSDIGDFHGIFAFAIHDTQSGKTWFARDRLGIKPLFVVDIPSTFSFASEIPALLQLRPTWKVDVLARSAFLAVGYISGPRTIFEDIRSLEPGIVWSHDGHVLKKEYVFQDGPVQPFAGSYAQAKSILAEKVDAAVQRQLVSDRPVGIFLSGGLDSSVVLSSMRQAIPRGTIKTFTTRFRHQTSDPKFNRDADLARLSAQRYGCEHIEVEVGASDMIERAEAMARQLAQPHNNSATVAIDAVAQLAATQVPVVLSGDGGDELFGGYQRYENWRSAARILQTPPLRAMLRGLTSIFPTQQARWKDILNAPDEAARLLSIHASPYDHRHQLYGEATDDSSVLNLWRELLAQTVEQDPVKRFMQLDRSTWLRDDAFVRSDRLTMRHGLELRVPLLDDELIAFARSLPSPWIVGLRQSKALWRDTFASRCIPEISQGAKRGWITPAAKWLRGDLQSWAQEILEEAIHDQPWLNGPAVRQAFADHQSGRRYGLIDIWTIMSYQLWWRIYRHHFTQA